MAKILVTGARGNVGRYVVEHLLKKGEDVKLAGTSLDKLINDFGGQLDYVVLDFLNPDTFENAFNNVDRVFLIRPPHLGHPEDLYPFIEEMKAHNIKLVSFLSLMGIENNSIPPHYKIEKKIEALDIPYAHIRPGFFMQNLSGVHSEEIREENRIMVPAGKSTTMFVDAYDIGLATATVLSNPEKYRDTTHTISGPKALTYYDIANILSEVLNRKISYSRPGFLKYRKHMLKRGFDKGYILITMALYLMTRVDRKNKTVSDDFMRLTGCTYREFKTFALENIDKFTKR